jgi:hypothetical protein
MIRKRKLLLMEIMKMDQTFVMDGIGTGPKKLIQIIDNKQISNR